MIQHVMQEDYKYYLESNSNNIITFLMHKHTHSCLLNELSTNPTPLHVMTRKVVVSSCVEQVHYLTIAQCDCGCYKRNGYPCKHMHCVTESIPNESYFYPECLKSCSRNMYQNKRYTENQRYNYRKNTVDGQQVRQK